jgi:hypothetical protein
MLKSKKNFFQGKTDFFGNHVDIASVRVNASPENKRGIK